MSTSELRSELHKLIDGITDSSTLQAIYVLLAKSNAKSDWFDELNAEQQRSVENGLKQANNQEFVSYKDVKSDVDRILGRA